MLKRAASLILTILMLYASVNIQAEEKKRLSIEDIDYLLRSPVSKKRISDLIKKFGIGFEKTEENIKKLKAAGADETIFDALRREWAKSDGAVIVGSNPVGATVYINGEVGGKTPYVSGTLYSRSCKVRVIMDGYDSWEREVSFETGKEVYVLFAELKKKEPRAGDIWRDPAMEMEFVFVKGGCFEMGDNFGDGNDDEKPVHEVCVDDLWMGKYEVKVSEFRAFVNDMDYKTEAERAGGCFYPAVGKWERDKGKNWRDAGFKSDDRHPVVCVSWNDAVAFARWLEGKTGKKYRLPTEAEWEYAARSGGKKYKYSWGNAQPSGNIADVSAKRKFPAWTIWEGYDDGYVFTSPVGTYKPNELGLYDMTGNVWQWCQDWYDKDYYTYSRKILPEGPIYGQYRVGRGGSWIDTPGNVRATQRMKNTPGVPVYNIGFRLVLPVPQVDTSALRDLQEAIEAIRKKAAIEVIEKRVAADREFEKSLVAKKEPGIEGEVLESKLFKDIHFDFDKYEIRPGDAEILKENAALLARYPTVKIQIEGHCDERNPTEYALILGERRANNARKSLISLGISPERISTMSYGKERPLDPGHNEEAWAKNRRAHFIILSR